MKNQSTSFSTFILLTLLLITAPFHTARAQLAPSLGAAQSFAVLGATTVTNTGPTIITGDLGVNPGSAITGFPPGLVIGATHAADALALQARTPPLHMLIWPAKRAQPPLVFQQISVGCHSYRVCIVLRTPLK